ncbi:MAG: LutC/YkgG family protein [Acidobacteriota bacterium]
MSRTAVLEKIRRACQSSSVGELPGALPEFPAFEDAVAKFRRELEGVRGIYLDVRQGKGDSLAAVLQVILEETESTEVYWENVHTLQKHAILFALAEGTSSMEGQLLYSTHPGSKVSPPISLQTRPYERENLKSISISVSSAYKGIAETGTIVHRVGPDTGRLLTALPSTHVVLLSQQDLLMNHADFFESISPGKVGSAFSLMTGPSRTADIEKTLVLGVHGPRQWYVILTD